MIPPLIINDVPISCINQAAITYRVPAILIISVLKTEDGHIGTATKNKNGSHDYGPMQINGRTWLKQLKVFGVTKYDVQYNPCINVAVGTWILASNIANNKQLWQGVGDYNSATPVFNHSYRVKVKNLYAKITSQLK